MKRIIMYTILVLSFGWIGLGIDISIGYFGKGMVKTPTITLIGVIISTALLSIIIKEYIEKLESIQQKYKIDCEKH